MYCSWTNLRFSILVKFCLLINMLLICLWLILLPYMRQQPTIDLLTIEERIELKLFNNALEKRDMLIIAPRLSTESIGEKRFSENTKNIFNDSTIGQEDPLILNYIRKYHLTPPSTEEYNLNKTISSMSYELHDVLERKLAKLFNGKKNGFFVECGALDGELFSHSLRLETDYNWNGILIEASPLQIPELKKKNRKVWIADVCLTGSYPEQLEFLSNLGKEVYKKGSGKLMPIAKYKKPLYFMDSDYEKMGIVDCFPLYSILAAANITSVDFFSLDIEGHEFKVLNAIPFEKINIEVIAVEHWLAPEGKYAIQELLESKGYTLWFQSTSDFVFLLNQKLN